MRRARSESGFTYLAVLFMVAIMGALLAATGIVWSVARQREKEQELLYIGDTYRKAIADYYEHTPGAIKRYPQSFADLLLDNRQLATVRHLRRLYRDPMTLKSNWGIVRAPDGGIKGIYSLSDEAPMKHGGFRFIDSDFEKAKHYSDWRFTYEVMNQVSPTKSGVK